MNESESTERIFNCMKLLPLKDQRDLLDSYIEGVVLDYQEDGNVGEPKDVIEQAYDALADNLHDMGEEERNEFTMDVLEYVTGDYIELLDRIEG